jgi:hypothetical protein
VWGAPGGARRVVTPALTALVLLATLAGVVVATVTPAGASTIVSETFTNASAGTPADWVSGGTGTLGSGTNVACLTAGSNTAQADVPGCGGTTDPAGSGALRLTTNGTAQTGWALYNTPVAAASGLNITFNSYQYNTTTPASGADGISFFIVPGTTNLTVPGSFGGYLGYGGGGTGSPTGTNGVTNGILNVGLDVFGNNAWTGYDGGHCSAGSTSNYPLSAAGEPTKSVPESVTVRGPGNAQQGYCWIANSGNLTTGDAAHALDYPSATARATSNTVKVNIVVPPPKATGPVADLTTTLTFPNGTTYTETAPEPPTSFIPTTFKFGFAGSSGTDTEYHEINDLTVTTSVPNPGVTSVSPAQTAVGSTRNVTISGINFTGATAVTVGGVAATNVVVVSDSEITATVPANATAGVYDTLVTSPGGTSNVNSGDKFTYGSSTTSLASSVNPSVVGQPVTYTATAVSSAASASSVVPTGHIEFLDGGIAIAACGGGTGEPVNGSGVATCPVTYTGPGTHTMTATYLGDLNYTGSTSSPLPQVVDKASTTTRLTSSANPSVVGQPVTFTGTASPVAPGAGTPTGTIEFLQGGTPIAACGGATGEPVNGAGVATCAVTYSATGTYAITATFPGDANFTTSTSTAVSQVVDKAATTTTLTSSANPSVVGQPVTLTATATATSPGSGTPTGTIEFLDGGTPIVACGGAGGEPVSAGRATCTVAFATSGTHHLTAVYAASAGYTTSTSSPLTQTVSTTPIPTSIGVGVSPNPVGGQPVTVTATISPSGTPSGTVTFTGPGGVVYCTATVVDGQASCVTSQLPVGTDTVTVAYPGDTYYLPSSGSVTFGVAAPVVNRGQGYWTDAADGGIFTFGDKRFFGSTGSLHLNAPAVGMASTPDDGGYWLVATDGGVFAFGDAGFYGSTGSLHLNKPIEGIAPTGDGKGYWMSASDGGIFAFGDATFKGSLANLTLNEPIVGMAPTPDGEGYWLVASDGGVFACGDAGFYGSTGALHLNKPIVAMAATPDGKGYWLVATDGGVFAFGDAGFYGSTGSLHLNLPVVGMASSPTGDGYWLDASDGGVFAFGDTKFWGSMGGQPLNKPMVGMSI